MSTAAAETQICDALVAELNDPQRVWAGQISAQRTWLPVYKPADLQSLKVSVVPMTLAQERLSRRITDKMTYGAVIDFQQLVDVTAGTAPLDALTFLVQQVHDFYRDCHKLATLPAAQVIEAKRDDIYSIEQLYTEHAWESQVALGVWMARDAIAFDPRTSYAGLLAWWHADYQPFQDTAGLVPATADGQAVARLNDHSGNGRNLVQLAGGAAQLKLPVQNGLPAVRLNGTSGLQALFTGLAPPFTYFLVGNLRSLGSPGVNDVVAAGGTSDSYGPIIDNRPETQIGNAAQTATVGYSALFPSWSVLTVQMTGTQATVRENRAQTINAAAVASADAGGFTLGSDNTGLRPSAFDVGEILLYAGVLPMEAVQQIEYYLRTRWGTP